MIHQFLELYCEGTSLFLGIIAFYGRVDKQIGRSILGLDQAVTIMDEDRYNNIFPG